MATFAERLRRAVRAAESVWEPGPYRLEGKTVTCPQCGGTEFAHGTAQLNTAGLTFVGLDWTNKSAHTLMCSECGRIEWFGQEPEKL